MFTHHTYCLLQSHFYLINNDIILQNSIVFIKVIMKIVLKFQLLEWQFSADV